MFENIGGKLKGLAYFLCIIGIIFSIFYGFYLIFSDRGIYDVSGTVGVLYLVFGPLISWVSAWALYGIGEAVENSENANYRIGSLKSQIDNIEKTLKQRELHTSISDKKQKDVWECSKCGKTNVLSNDVCWNCGEKH